MDNSKSNHRGGDGAPPTTTNATSTPTKPSTENVTPRRRGVGVKRKANNTSSSSGSKRRGRTSTPLPHLHHNHNGPVTRARQSPHKSAAAGAANATTTSSSLSFYLPGAPDKPSDPPLQPVTTTTTKTGEITTASLEQSVPIANDRKLDMDMDAEFEAIRSRDPTVHVIPTTAAWFSWTKIHPIEERALVSFFNGKVENRSSDVYMEIRNSIMKKFHADPKTQIEIKDLSELTSGELDARREVMEFLDHWGLINFHPFPAVDSQTAEVDSGGLSKKALLVDKLYQFEVATRWCPEVGHKPEVAKQAAAPLKLLSESSVVDEGRPEGPSVEYHCNSCGADCSRRRYHCQKQADFDLCSECYNDGKFDSGMSPADFILMEPAEVPGISGGSWTDQETLLLLEALELFGGNWSEIAEHVATKSKAQCILHFVQMPIEDSFLEGMDDFDASLPGNNGPGPVCDDSSALKEAHEGKENDTTDNGSSSFTKSAETTESKYASETRPLSPKLGSSDSRHTVEVKVAQDSSANFAINALKEAFQAVGSEDSFSFADAGNPVMALVAFLSALVGPDVAAASARSSVKTTEVESPGIHLASKHCFILEDPPEDLKDTPAPQRNESADTEMLDAEAYKDDDKAQKDELNNVTKDEPLKEEYIQVQNKSSVEAQKDEKPKEEDLKVQSHMTLLDDKDVSKRSANKEIEDTVTKETVVPDEGKEKCKATDLDDVIKEDVAIGIELNNSAVQGDLLSPQDSSLNKLNQSAIPGEDHLSPQDRNKGIFVLKESNDSIEKEDDGPRNMKDPDDVALQGNDLPISVNGSDESTIPSEIAPISLKESASIGPPEEISQIPEEANDVDMDSSLVSSKSNDPQDKVAHCSVPPDNKVPQVAVAPSSVPSENEPSSDIARDPLKESISVGPLEVKSQFTEQPKDVDMDSGLTSSERRDPQEEVAPSSVLFGNKDPQETAAPNSVPSKSAPSLAPSENKAIQETVAPSSAVETGLNTGECGVKVADCISEMTVVAETRDDPCIAKIKRAALTALSAAAVKSKLLADQEEDQIRQLATFLIEKQLQKIETKLGFFADIESAVMRAKDQMDKSRQRLYHERAQIIAARLGMPPPSSRAMPPSLPSNRAAISYTGSVPKSLQSINSQMGPVRTITNTPAPPPSFPSIANAARGGATHTSQ